MRRLGDYSGWDTIAEWHAYEAGIIAEQERIIDVLQNIKPGSGVMGDDVSLAIEIIKGEN